MSYLSRLWSAVRFTMFFYLGVISSLLLLGHFFGFSLFLILSVLLGATALRSFLYKTSFFAFLKACVVVTLVVCAFWFIPLWLGYWALWLLLGLFVAYRFFKGRVVFMTSLRFIERTLFGKPLDKSEWSKDEKPNIYSEDVKDDKQ